MKYPIRVISAAVAAAALSGCASTSGHNEPLSKAVRAETSLVISQVESLRPDHAKVVTPVIEAKGPEGVDLRLPSERDVKSAQADTRKGARLDVLVKLAPARDVLAELVRETPYSMTIHPDVKGSVSLQLRRVTLEEALETVRDMYGYDIRIDGSRISVYPATMQTRTYVINYLSSKRKASSTIRVGDRGEATSTGTNGATSTTPVGQDSSSIQTTKDASVWDELSATVKAIVGTEAGRAVNITPHAGLLTVRAMPAEHVEIEQYLDKMKSIIGRQVMIEAKIVDITLSDGFQSGVNWSSLSRAGDLSVNAQGTVTSSGLIDLGKSAASGALAIKLAAGSFTSAMSLLESFGDLNVLSSPRIATINNQAAVLKVGDEQYYATNISGGSTTAATAAAGATTTAPNITWTRFFSGVALDVTPQIDERGNIMLHVHPSVSNVTQVDRVVDLGNNNRQTYPLAKVVVSETDSIVSVEDGQIVAIGGLMQSSADRTYSGIPGANGVPVIDTIAGNKKIENKKRELVILMKATKLGDKSAWARANEGTGQRLADLEQRMRRPADRVIQFGSRGE